jgi:hypothetical protein
VAGRRVGGGVCMPHLCMRTRREQPCLSPNGGEDTGLLGDMPARPETAGARGPKRGSPPACEPAFDRGSPGGRDALRLDQSWSWSSPPVPRLRANAMRRRGTGRFPEPGSIRQANGQATWPNRRRASGAE